MIEAIKNRLKEGSITNVIRFGEDLPQPDYVVVKSERTEYGRLIRIIAHANAENISILEPYIFTELSQLINAYNFTATTGEEFSLIDVEWNDIIGQSDDNTYSMERVYLLPMMLY